jgi:predicted transcriptional regulator
VADAMVTSPTLHGPQTTVGELRAFFRDDHVHAALLVNGEDLIGVIERADLEAELSDDMPAAEIATTEGRTIQSDARAGDTLRAMKRTNRRRLAVIDDQGALLGVLCLKASGFGFCSDSDVRRRSAGESSRSDRDPWLGIRA